MIPIRAIQHYAYCPHRWGMLYLEGTWAENGLTVQGDLLHARVHREKQLAQSRGALSYGGMSLYSRSLGIYGKADLVEFVGREKGATVPGLPGRYLVRLVEYKPTAPNGEVHSADRLQLYAQFCCAREIFGDHVEACFYFADTRRRLLLSFDASDRALLERVIAEIAEAQQERRVPPVLRQEGCNGCSMADLCMPRVRTVDVRSAIEECL